MNDMQFCQGKQSVIKLAQYLSSLTTQQDPWKEAADALVCFFGTDLVAFGERRPDGEIFLHHWTFSGRNGSRTSLISSKEIEHAAAVPGRNGIEIEEAIIETLDSGFLTSRCLNISDTVTVSAAFLPIALENRVTTVMLVGHRALEPLSKEVLDVYLAVAGLVGTTAARLASEGELGKHRHHLQELVKERTSELKAANDRLQMEITQRKRAEEELLCERDNLNRIFETMEDRIYIVNRKHEIEYVNPAFERDFGSPNDGKCYENLNDREEPCPWCPAEDVFAGKTTRREWFCAKNAKTYDMIETPLRNADGSISKLAIFRDNTERKRAEEEKARLEEQFHQAQKLESIGRLAGGVAHDLNNLLSPILGYGEMILEGVYGDVALRRPVEEMVNAGMRARELVQQLLAFSRKQTLRFKQIDLNILLKEFERLLRSSIREDVAIHVLMTEPLPLVKGDSGQLEQVLMNLAINAQDSMPDGGDLTIETAPVELDENCAARHEGVKPGPYVMLMVSDTGCGMDADAREHLFEPFFTTKGKVKGTGLGLSTVYGIVKQHGGNIWVYSEPGRGTAFKIYLPVSQDSPAPRPDETRAGASQLEGTETVLLVEDNEYVRDMTLAILKRMGYSVLVADNGRAGLELLDNHEAAVDLLLTDVVMPGMNGKELYIRATEKRPDLKVLYMSGYTENVIAHRGILENGVAFIQKPFTVKSLAAKVREVLDR